MDCSCLRAEAAAAMSGAEVVELRSELTRLRGAMDAAVLPHLKRQVSQGRDNTTVANPATFHGLDFVTCA